MKFRNWFRNYFQSNYFLGDASLFRTIKCNVKEAHKVIAKITNSQKTRDQEGYKESQPI